MATNPETVTQNVSSSNGEAAQANPFDLPKPEDWKEAKTFSPDEFEARQNEIQAWAAFVNDVSEARSIPLHTNTVEGSPDEGFDLVFAPVTKQAKEPGKPRELQAIVIGQIPSFALAQNDENGRKRILSAYVSDMTTRLVGAVRRSLSAKTGTVALPKSTTDFFTAQRGLGSQQTYRKLAAAIVTELRKIHGFEILTQDILRNCLASSQYAEQLFPRVSKEHWLGILNWFRKAAKNETLDASIFDTWENTRDDVRLVEVSQDTGMSLDDMLSGLGGDPDDEDDSENEQENATASVS